MKMDVWTIVADAESGLSERLAAMLNQSFAGLAGQGGEGPWELPGDGGLIRCCLKIGQGRDEFCNRTSHVLAEYTVMERELVQLRQLLHNQYGFCNPIELDVMISEAIGLLDGEPEADEAVAGRGRDKRIRRLAQQFAAYLRENEFLHLEGFIRFRLRDYEAEVKEAAATVAEERLMDRQYEEFVSLLHSMVEWQEVRVPEVHVLHGGGHAFRLLDEKLRPLEKEAPSWAETSEEQAERDSLEEESLLVSRLLAVSPRRLYIHTREPEAQVIRTLMGIFGERAALYPEQPT